MKVNFKKIIKGVIGFGAVGGIAYAAYKHGESEGRRKEILRRIDEVEDDDDFDFEDDDDEEPLSNYYGTCFEQKYDEPDDGCLAAYEEQEAEPHNGLYVFGNVVTSCPDYHEEYDNVEHVFTRLRNLDAGDIPMKHIIHAFAVIKEFSWITNTTLLYAMNCSYDTCVKILDVFEKAGYVSEKNYKFKRKVFVRNIPLENLL